jgi:hypothetical protein
LCTDCGALHDPRVDDPMRRDASVNAGSCTQCSGGLADLSHVPTVYIQREVDSAEVGARKSALWRGLRWAAAGTGALLGLGLAGLCVLSIVLFPLAPAMLWVGIAWARYAQPGPRRLMPNRWRLPGGSNTASWFRPTDAVPVLDAEPLRAPLTGRPCVAYEVGVRQTAGPNAPLNQWLSLEQRNAPMRLDGSHHAKDSVRLALARQELTRDEIVLDDAGLARFLRERGFLPSDELVFYETVVVEGEDCKIAEEREGGPPLVRAA